MESTHHVTVCTVGISECWDVGYWDGLWGSVDYIMYSGYDIIQLVECYPLWQVEVCMQNWNSRITLQYVQCPSY